MPPTNTVKATDINKMFSMF